MGHQYQMGCLKCGKQRRTQDVMKKKYDILLRDTVHNTLVDAGLCAACFELSDFDLDDLGDRLYKSELACARAKGRSDESVENFKDAKYGGWMRWKDYEKKLYELYPNPARDIKNPMQYIEIVPCT